MKLPYLSEKELANKIKNSKFADSVLTEKALTQAKKTHQNQKRDDGQPYLEEHIYPIVVDLLDHFENENNAEDLIVAAALHDVLEDDEEMTYEKFIDEFSQEIFDIVKPLTKNREQNLSNLSQEEKQKINKEILANLASAPQFSKIIKLADRANNLAAVSKIKESNKPKYERYLSETEEDFLTFAKKENQYYYCELREMLENLNK